VGHIESLGKFRTVLVLLSNVIKSAVLERVD